MRKLYEIKVPAVFTFTIMAETDEDARDAAFHKLRTDALANGVEVDVEVAETCMDIEEVPE